MRATEKAHRLLTYFCVLFLSPKHENEVIIIGKITVVDAPCGAGKTSWAIRMINADPERAFVYCTPFLSEIGRIRDACGRGRIAEPQYRGTTKLEDFNRLLAEGGSIAVTHMTLLNATSDTLRGIHEGKYTLILDECLDVVCDFNSSPHVDDAPQQIVSADDIKMLRDKRLIEVDSNYKVRWIGDNYGDDFKFREVMRQANHGNLYCVREEMLVVVYPPEVFREFEQVYVLTYKSDGNLLSAYFELFGIEHEKMSIIQSGEEYELVTYSEDADADFRRSCHDLITVCGNERLNDNGTLSVSWYINAKQAALKSLKNNVGYYFFRELHEMHPKGRDIMWTCPNEYRKKIQGKGYTCVRSLTAEELKLPEEERKKYECFVPCNAKATNVYRDRWALAYCCNMFQNPMIRGFFNDRGIGFDEDEYALSALIQWIFRSRIRDGLPIWIYIPSSRMRNLLERWLEV